MRSKAIVPPRRVLYEIYLGSWKGAMEAAAHIGEAEDGPEEVYQRCCNYAHT